jgi:hypothetical protein
MNDSIKFQRFAAITALAAFILSVAQVVVSLAATHFDASALLNPSNLTSLTPDQAQVLRWSMILDVLGDYLLLIPLMLYLWTWLKPRSPNFALFYTLCGLAYPLIGSIGAIVMAAVMPLLIIQYGQAAVQQREIIQVVFDTFVNAVYQGLWNPLEVLFLGVWFVGIGSLLRKEKMVLGTITVILGAFALLDPLGRFLQVEIIFQIGIGGMGLFFPLWILWLAIDLLRRRGTSAVQQTPEILIGQKA